MVCIFSLSVVKKPTLALIDVIKLNVSEKETEIDTNKKRQ